MLGEYSSNSVVRVLRMIPGEALFWTGGLLAVMSINPDGQAVLDLCLFEQVGLWCPGDGLGRSIAYLARGRWVEAWTTHPLAVPVVGVLLYHIGTLWRRSSRRAERASLVFGHPPN